MNLFSYNPFDHVTFDYDKCFLCGTDKNITKEHFFPSWLQRKYKLVNKKLGLLNETLIKYKKLTVPCCKECNNVLLNKNETLISNAVSKGYSEFVKLDEKVIYQWISKILYGIVFQEMHLKYDVTNPNSNETILDEQAMSRFVHLHQILQSIRLDNDFEFHGRRLWSIFVFKIHKYNDDEKDFDFYDNIQTLTVGIHMGDIGIIACLDDAGTTKEVMGSHINDYQNITLHPIQFEEIFVTVVCFAFTLNISPTLRFERIGSKMKLTVEPVDLPDVIEPDEQQQELCLMLRERHFSRYELPSDITYLRDGEGKVIRMNADWTPIDS